MYGDLTFKQKASWVAHTFKAVCQQHHKSLLPVFRELIPADGVVFDVGAHGGQFTKLFADLVPDGHVFAFEPSPYSLSILSNVVRVRRLKNVTVLQLGLSDVQSELVLQTPIKTSGSVGYGRASMVGAHSGPMREDVVPVSTIDEIVRRFDLSRLDFIKADIEGWEGRMLAGGADSLARFEPSMLLEMNAELLERSGRCVQDVWRTLSDAGYRACKLGDGWMPGDRVRVFAGDGDYLFTASEGYPSEANVASSLGP